MLIQSSSYLYKCLVLLFLFSFLSSGQCVLMFLKASPHNLCEKLLVSRLASVPARVLSASWAWRLWWRRDWDCGYGVGQDIKMWDSKENGHQHGLFTILHFLRLSRYSPTMFLVWSTVVWGVGNGQKHFVDKDSRGDSKIAYLEFWGPLWSLVELGESDIGWPAILWKGEWKRGARMGWYQENRRLGVHHVSGLPRLLLAGILLSKDLIDKCRVVLKHWLAPSLVFYMWRIVICSSAHEMLHIV